jgi:hypothetical protein
MKFNCAIHCEKGHILIRNTCSVWTKYDAYRNYGSQIFFCQGELTTFPKSINDKYIPLDTMSHQDIISVNVRNLPIVNEVDTSLRENVDNNSLIDYFRNHTKWYKNLIKNTTCNYSQIEINEILNNNKFLIGSDGGVRQQRAGIGIVTTTNMTTILHNAVRIPETYNDMTSYRCEAVGILGAIYTYISIQVVRQHMGLDTRDGILTIICDSESVVKIINKMKRTQPTTKFFYSVDADIIYEILMAIKLIWNRYGTVTFTHVKGHQDRNGGTLSYEARVHVESDGLATSSLRQQNVPQLDTYHTNARLMINNKLVTSHQNN